MGSMVDRCIVFLRCHPQNVNAMLIDYIGLPGSEILADSRCRDEAMLAPSNDTCDQAAAEMRQNGNPI
jgi:hypothetical protein